MRNGLGTVALGLVAIVCCAGLPLLLAAGVSSAAAAWLGGIMLGLVVFAAALAFLALRARRRAASHAKRQRRGSAIPESLKEEVQIR